MTPVPHTTPQKDPWFASTVGLVGCIVGFSIGMAVSGGMSSNSPAPSPAPTPVAAVPTPAPAAPQAGEITPPTPETDYFKGDPKALISVIEWSDAECPFCKRHHPTMQALIDNPKYKGKINWVYRHFPLAFHTNAQKTAEAQECAGEQGGDKGFWDFTDHVFKNTADVTKLADYAEAVGLDRDKLQDCVDSGKFEQKVKDQMADGSKAGVKGTPGTVVYNNETKEAKLISGAQPVSVFEAAIDAMLE